MNSELILVGVGYTTWNGGIFRWGARGMKTKFMKDLREVTAEEFGRFDSACKDRRLVTSGKLWSGYENLPLVFPSAAFQPEIGGRLFGTANLPLVNAGQDGSKLTCVNTQLTKMANMMLAVEADLWSADVEFTSLLLSGGDPATQGDYYNYQIGQSYAAPAFNKTNFRAPKLSAGWAGTLGNGGTSFASFSFRKGAALAWKWDLDFEPFYCDGYGTVDASIAGFEADCTGTPIGVIEVDAAAVMAPAQSLGVLESTNGGDLTLTFGANSIIIHQAFVSEHDGLAWSRKNNRIGQMTWRSTVPFSGGEPTARATAS